jgi:hypothetical protein
MSFREEPSQPFDSAFYRRPKRTTGVALGKRPSYDDDRRLGYRVRPSARREENAMIVLGIVLLILGWLLGISILWTIGIILVVIGVILWILGSMGRAVGGRRHYW